MLWMEWIPGRVSILSKTASSTIYALSIALTTDEAAFTGDGNMHNTYIWAGDDPNIVKKRHFEHHVWRLMFGPKL
jgi:hypothetical protein